MEVPLSNETLHRLARVAEEQGRDSGTLAAEAIDRMLDYEEWLLNAVEEAEAQMDRGEFIEHEEVVKMINRRFRA